MNMVFRDRAGLYWRQDMNFRSSINLYGQEYFFPLFVFVTLITLV